MTDVGAPDRLDPWPDREVHVEWGSTGAGLAAARGDIVVVVDVLSFSTTLAVAVDRAFTCLVYSGAEIERLGGPEAAGAALRARPLSKSRRVPPGHLSLSPESLLTAAPGQRVLFTSLNGAAAAGAAADAPALLVGGLRNASATAALVTRLLAEGVAERVTVVACGEQWSSVQAGVEGMRPSLEDWTGAGLICARLAEAGHTLSAEAAAAAGSWNGPAALASCVSARELLAAGFDADVALALEVDVSDIVPVRVEKEDTGRVFEGVAAAVGEG
jgi:2-phosphosulfolactate phosphatase